MKFIFTLSRKAQFKFCPIFILALFSVHFSLAQSTVINAVSISSQSNVDFSANAIDSNLNTKAEIRASSGLVIGVGAYSGSLELQFPITLPGNTTSYVKIDTDENLLPSLLGGTLGCLLSNVTGAVLVGNQEFTVQAKNNATVILEGNSQIANNFANDAMRVVVNANNEYFIAITPSLPYNRIKITNRLGSLVGLGNTKKLGVYGAFYVDSPDVCGGASYTSFDGSGLNLDLLGLGGAGVTNPHFALDANQNNFSRLSLGILAVAGSIQQTVYFDGQSQLTDQYFIKLKVDPSLLALGLANNIDIIAQNGSTTIQSVTLNSLLNFDLLTLLQGNQVVSIPFSPNGVTNKITVRYRSLLNVQLTQSIDLYSVNRAPANPTIIDAFTLNPIVCSGTTASLVAQSTTGTVLNWYSQPQGGILLATTNSGQPFITPILTQNTTFYVASKRTNCSEESSRIRIDVTVVTTPNANDILISNSVEACNGFTVLSPMSTIGGVTFRYYKDQLKTQEITTGYAGDVGVTYALNATTGQLTISGLTALNSPYNYYISITVNSLCENPVNTLKQVTVTYSSGLTLNVQPTIQGCGSVDLSDAIINFDSSNTIQYSFFDNLNNPITSEAASNITTSGTYFIQATSVLGGCSSSIQQVVVTVNASPTLSILNQNIVVATGNSVTLQATSNSSITWYNSNGNALPGNVTPVFTMLGNYTFTAVAGTGSCSISLSVFITVVDAGVCPILSERVYANSQSWNSVITGGVTNAGNAVDHNPKTFSTITTGLGLLGIGTTSQSIQWDATIQAGIPVSVKLGSQYSGLSLVGIYSIVGTKRNSSGVPVDIGFIQPISVSILDLLPGENSFEFTFVPSDITGPKNYDGIRIIVGSIASVAQNLKIYDAYYNNQVAQITCNPDDVKDVFSGATDLGVGVATATVGVDNPYNSVDSSVATFATMYSGAGILAAANLTVEFKTPSLSGDSLEITISRPATILNLNLLTGLSMQMYLGNTPVGPVIDPTSNLLTLSLLNGGTEALILIQPQTQPYDKIKIMFGGVAGVLDFLRVHNIERVANTHVIGADQTNSINVCANTTIQLEVQAQPCLTYIWYDALTGGNIVSTGTSFTIPSTLLAGTYNFYVQPVRFGCEFFRRGKVTVIIGQTTPSSGITQLLVNGSPTTTFCSQTGSVTFTATLNSTVTQTNPVFYWYLYTGTTSQLISGETTSTLVISNLAPGTYTYQVGVSSDEYCETSEADRVSITITILPFSQPTDITAADTTICQGQNAVVSPSTTYTNPQFTWYFANDNLQPITNGLVVGNSTYTIATDGTLTVSGLTTANNTVTYYVGLISDNSCLNQNGNFKPVVITVNGGTTPTTNNASQNFCLINNPMVSNLQVNETGVNWFLTSSGGTVLNPMTLLLNGTTYYASITDGSTCESSVRLAVSVTISSGITPTTTNANQNFCLINNPTIADLQTNETGVTWYLTPSLGIPLNSATPLVNGTTYYGSLIDAFGCESAVRLAVNVIIGNGTTPTTNDSTQDFCLVTNPTVANLQANETGVFWFTTPTGGTALSTTTVLVNGTTYYGSFNDVSGCASPIRLAVAVTVNSGTTPTTNDNTQTFCVGTNPTVASIQVNESGVSWFTTSFGGNALNSATPLINGATYYGSLVDASGCESAVRLTVTVVINTDGASINGGSPTACTFSQVTYTTNPEMTNYLWTIANGTIISGGQSSDNFVTVSYQTIGAASVTVSYLNVCGISDSAVYNLNVQVCSDLTISKTVDNAAPSIDDNVVFTISVTNVGTSDITNVIVSEQLPSGYSFVSSNSSTGNYNTLSGIWDIPLLIAGQSATLLVTATVLPTGNYLNTATITSSTPIDSDLTNNTAQATITPICLIVYNEFSPNNDGSNDVLIIDCIENYPKSIIEVYNRYGALVYSKNNYTNDWDGTANVSGTFKSGEKLPTGTYYYILNLNVDSIVKKGWLSLTK